MRNAFTLIELLVVIAIIAILAVVVVLTLNPTELLRQSRDANRVSDMATLNSAINLYNTDQSGSIGYTLGNASSVYVSLTDTTSTCANLGLATAPTGYTYACASATSSRNINNTGWIPINFSTISAGSPLGSLPVDPTNASSSGLYYTYSTNGTQYEVTSLFESAKYKAQYGQSPMDPSYPEVNAQGNSLSVSPLFNPSGLVGWWPLTEGSGSSSIDQSGNGNNGNWTGTASGTNGTYYAGGRVGSWAGYFNGSTDAVNTVSNPSPTGSSRTVCAWIKTTTTSRGGIIDTRGSGSGGFFFSVNRTTAGNLTYAHNGGSAVEIAAGVNNGQWNFVCAVYNVSLAAASLYENGTILGTISSFTAELTTTSTVQIGEDSTGGDLFSGLIDDVRIYNRALSAAEIMAIYNAEK